MASYTTTFDICYKNEGNRNKASIQTYLKKKETSDDDADADADADDDDDNRIHPFSE
jgi:hypothetical protein